MGNIVHGLRDGIPIAMGYFAVAFSLGIIAKKAGLTAVMGFFSSFFTRASAGEYGVYTLVAVNAAFLEIVVMCFVANLRYMLMSAALSQKIAPGTPYAASQMKCSASPSIILATLLLPIPIRRPYSQAFFGAAAVLWASLPAECCRATLSRLLVWLFMECLLL